MDSILSFISTHHTVSLTLSVLSAIVAMVVAAKIGAMLLKPALIVGALVIAGCALYAWQPRVVGPVRQAIVSPVVELVQPMLGLAKKAQLAGSIPGERQ